MPNHVIRQSPLVVKNSASKKFGVEKTGEILWTVVGEDLTTTVDDIVYGTPEIPSPWQVVAGASTTMYATEVNATRTGTGFHPTTGVEAWVFDVRAVLSNALDVDKLGGQDPANIDALLLPADVSGTTITELVEDSFDFNGNRVTDYFNRPIKIKRPNLLQNESYEKWLPSPFDRSIILTYANTCNAAAFYDYPAGTVRMARITHREQSINGVKYSRVKFDVQIKLDHADPSTENTWIVQDQPHQTFEYIDDDGFRQEVNENGIKGPFLTSYFTGKRFKDGDNEADFYVNTELIRKVDWSPLAL